MITRHLTLVSVLTFSLILAACGGEELGKVCAVIDAGGENERNIDTSALNGARDAAEDAGLEFSLAVSEGDDGSGAAPDSDAEMDDVENFNNLIDEGCGLIVTVGSTLGEATASAARENSDVHFAIVDYEYGPGIGCDENLSDCYEKDLTNVTSLMFAEDEVGYLAGVLAGCMSETGVVASVSGMEIASDVKYVVGYQTGAKSQNPDIETLNVYIPDFNDPATGKQAGQAMLDYGADIIFGVGDNTGNGGILAAHEAGNWGIGVDVDQYFAYPDVASSLLTSAAKNVDVAVYDAVLAYTIGELEGGIRRGTIENRGIGLAPYHDQVGNILAECKAAVEEAEARLAAGEIDTGYRP